MQAPAPSSDVCDLAASALLQAGRGERAGTALMHAIREQRLSPAEAETLSTLVHGVLRRELRLERALARVSGGDAWTRERRGEPEWLKLVVASALLDASAPSPEGTQRGPLDAGAARTLCGGVEWERLVAADRELFEGAGEATRVALAGSLPEWLAARILVEYPSDAVELASSLSQPAPRSLRANTLKVGVQELQEQLEQEGAELERGAHAKLALRLRGAFNPFVTRAFHAGAFELQDEGSQLVCELTAPPPRGLVVDACAGAGGKTLALAAMLEGRGKLLSLDVEAGKLAELRRRASRAGAVNVQALAIEPAGAFPEVVTKAFGRADRVLVDAPCSGTGVLRRNPEARHALSPEAVTRLAATQRSILERMLPLLAPGARLIFATCSLLREEGEAVMDELEAAHPELMPVDLAEIYGRPYVDRFVRSAPHRLRLLPHLHDCDGFFIACLRKRR